MFLRTGLPPRVAKRILTSREERELREFYARYPFNDEANFQIPQARMYASYLNAHRKEGAEPAQITDFILGFPPANQGQDEDDEDDPVIDSDVLDGKGW